MVAANPPAPQHEPHILRRTPRPLPLFLDLVRAAAAKDPELARRAMAGLHVYADAPRPEAPTRAVVAEHGRARILDGGGSKGPPVLLVPSLINPSRILDLGGGRSLLDHLATEGYRPMLFDWGSPGRDEAERDIAGHIEGYLLPLLDRIGEPVHLVGYCLGGTMSMAAAALRPLRSLTLMATPWQYGAYPEDARQGLGGLWARNAEAITAMGVLPMEILQTAFWNLDPERTVAKFAALAELAADSAQAMNFAILEDWANEGAPLTVGAARDLFLHFIGEDRPGRGQWQIGGITIDPAMLTMPTLQLVASGDRIAPAATATHALPRVDCPSGHVGMIVGSKAAEGCWAQLTGFLKSVDQR